MQGWPLAALLAALAAAVAGLGLLRRRPLRRSSLDKYLLVIAHPDDESMFFGPALADVAASGAPLHVLCLSTGAARA